MSDIAILYEDDHDTRAIALQASLANRAKVYPVLTTPCKQPGLTRLIFWGHGDEKALCGRTAADIHRIIKEWRQLNDGLAHVEIITCNSAHWRPAAKKKNQARSHYQSTLAHLGGKAVNDSFGKQIKRSLKYSGHKTLQKIHVWGMAHSDVSGHKNVVSILLWDKDTSTWALIPGAAVAGSTEKFMNWKKQMLIVEMKPPPLLADQSWEWYTGNNLSGPLPERLQAAIRLHNSFKRHHSFLNPPAPKAAGALMSNAEEGRAFLALDFSDCRAGTVHQLRDALVEIY